MHMATSLIGALTGVCENGQWKEKDNASWFAVLNLMAEAKKKKKIVAYRGIWNESDDGYGQSLGKA